MKEKVISSLLKLTNLSDKDLENLIEIPKDSKLGDFAFPCFILSKSMKKNPVQIAEELLNKIDKTDFEDIQAVGPYLNFFLKKDSLASLVLKKIMKEKDKYGSSDIGKGKKVAVDFSGPNAGKPLHVGHIRSTILGDSIIKIHNFLGFKTIGINHIGDVGLHLGKLIVAWELWLNKKALKQDPTRELLRLYVQFCDNEKSEIQEGEDIELDNNAWTNKAKAKLKLIEEGDKKTIKIWEEIVRNSIKGFDEIYKRLLIQFDQSTGASRFANAGKDAISEALKKGTAKKDETGAIFVEFSNLPKKFVLRSNGTASYMTLDIGAAIERLKKYKFDKMIYITDYRQQLHFQQLFEIVDKFGYNIGKRCIHIPFGTINFGNEIMATRVGKIILLKEVLDKVVERASEEMKKRNSKGDPEKVAVSALKYAILKTDPQKDVSFSWEQALSFEGNTGPYILYTYARANSILSKKTLPKKFLIPLLSDTEKRIITKLNEFPEVVKRAYEQLSPNSMANYVHSLSQEFNEFYHSSKVIGSEQEAFRLNLVWAIQQVIFNSLQLLGISTTKRM